MKGALLLFFNNFASEVYDSGADASGQIPIKK